MKNRIPTLIAIIALLTAASCSQQSDSPKYNRITANAVSISDSVTTTAENRINVARRSEDERPTSLSDPSRKIIKTADLRCRVADVFAATTRIERLAASLGGGIANSRLENVTDETRTLPYSTDSLKQVESYTTTAHLTLRIPVQQLDTVLADVAAGASFINSRNLQLDDVTLRYLSNKLKNEAMAANDAAAHAQALAKRSADAVYSGAYADNRNETNIERKIENMKLRDDVAFATLSVDLYQPQRLAQTVVPDIESLMKPGIGQRVAMAFAGGWHMLQQLLIILLAIWPVILLLIAGIIGYRRYRKSAQRGLITTRG